MPKHRVTLSALSLVLILAGCGTATDPSTGTSASEGGNPQTSTSSEAVAYNDNDVMFAQMMIPHHEQAVEMADIMLDKDDLDPKTVALSEKIKEAQAPEIERLNGFLESWGQPATADSMDHAMDGMLSKDDLDRLKAAQGEEASQLFLEQMTEHHEGAVAMAKEEAAKGDNPEAVALAEDIVSAQESEIQEMQEMLAAP